MVFEYILTFTTLTIYTMVRHFWTDIHELKVDSRRNHMMYGVILTLGIISGEIFTLIVVGLLTILFMKILSLAEENQKAIVFGDGDKEILTWSIPGIAIVFGFQLAVLFVFLIAISFFILAWLRHKKKIPKEKFPGLILLAISYIIILIIGWFF